MRQHQPDSWKSTFTLMGIRPHVSRLAYIDGLYRLLVSILGNFAILTLFAADIVICIELAQHPLKDALVFLYQQGWTLLTVNMFALVLLIVMCLYTRQELKYMKGLIALKRADPTRSLPIHLADYLETSVPPWLEHSQPVELPQNVFDALWEQEHSEEPWMKNLATFLDERVTEFLPPVSILICLRERIIISVLGPGGKRRQIPINQEQTAGMIGWLALRDKGMWVRRREIIRPIYGEDSDIVTKHISRLNKSLNKAIQSMLMQPTNTANLQGADQGETRLKLIDYAEDPEDRRENRWRLSLGCSVEVFPEVLSLYDQVMQEEKHVGCTSLDSDTLYASCHQMIERYGKGLFASYQKRHLCSYWPWAKDAYICYQEKCLYVLEYAAKREWKNAAQKKEKSDARYASIRRAAQYYAWMVDVALEMIPHRACAERAIHHCLALYRIIRDFASGRAIYQTYADYMIERDADWEPSEKIINAWPEVTTLS